jgi:hypothetical protein
MIPTKMKSKLPKTLSYPIGAEAISAALADVPQYGDFALHFSDTPVWPGAEFRRCLQLGLPYPVLRIEHKPKRKPGYAAADFTIERGWYDSRWEVTIYPVLRELKRTVAELLLSEAFPEAVRLLKLWADDEWAMRRLVYSFNAAEATLTVGSEREQ